MSAFGPLQKVSLKARYLYLGLCLLADQNGRIMARPKSIRQVVFEGDPTTSVTDVNNLIEELYQQRLIDFAATKNNKPVWCLRTYRETTNCKAKRKLATVPVAQKSRPCNDETRAHGHGDYLTPETPYGLEASRPNPNGIDSSHCLMPLGIVGGTDSATSLPYGVSRDSVGVCGGVARNERKPAAKPMPPPTPQALTPEAQARDREAKRELYGVFVPWLANAAGMPDARCKPIIAKWVQTYGAGLVLDIFRNVSDRPRKPDKPLAYIAAALKSNRAIVHVDRVPAELWRSRFADFRADGYWLPEEWGPEPGDPGCMVPKFLVDAG